MCVYNVCVLCVKEKINCMSNTQRTSFVLFFVSDIESCTIYIFTLSTDAIFVHHLESLRSNIPNTVNEVPT